jgi:hypothetical protein
MANTYARGFRNGGCVPERHCRCGALRGLRRRTGLLLWARAVLGRGALLLSAVSARCSPTAGTPGLQRALGRESSGAKIVFGYLVVLRSIEIVLPVCQAMLERLGSRARHAARNKPLI